MNDESVTLPTLERQDDYWVQPGTKYRTPVNWADQPTPMSEKELDSEEAYHLRMAAVIRLTRKERERHGVEAQVKALVDALEGEWFPDDRERADILARRLVERGVRVADA